MAFTLQPGAPAPGFALPAATGGELALSEITAEIVVVCFSCNHCPYVIGSEDRMIAFQEEFGPRGVQLIAINSNDLGHYPEDSFDHMVERARDLGYNFPYLRDDDQSVAIAYGAIKTPHFFVMDSGRVLRYTGRMDDNPKDAAAATTHELRDAVENLLAGQPVATPITQPVGCTVKWRGRDRKFIPADACDLVL